MDQDATAAYILRAPTAYFYKRLKDLFHFFGISDDGQYFHLRAALVTREGVYLITLGNPVLPTWRAQACGSALR